MNNNTANDLSISDMNNVETKLVIHSMKLRKVICAIPYQEIRYREDLHRLSKDEAMAIAQKFTAVDELIEALKWAQEEIKVLSN